MRIQANSQPSIVFSGDAEALPESFRKVSVTYSPDRDKILQAAAMEIPLPAGLLVVKGSHLRLS
jgi:hypothetical protein